MRIVIVGGVAAGMSAAAKARRTDKDAQIVIYEKSDVVSWGACGMPYFVGDFFQKPEILIARPVNKLRDTGLDIKILHEVLHVDTRERKIRVKDLAGGDVFEDSYDMLMIATGAHAIIPPIENMRLSNVFTLNEYADGITLKEAAVKAEIREVVIIGAGFIGVELIEAMLKLGKSVRVIQLDPRVLPEVFDKEITDLMEQEIITQGVSLHLSETVKAFKGGDRITGVVTDKGEYKADLAVICTGVRPNTAFLKDGGFDMLRNGALVIDHHGETSIKGVYAAGDCASVYHKIKKEHVYIPLATTANKIGRIVGDNLAGKDSSFEGTLGSAAIKVLDMEAGRTGITEGDAIKSGIRYKSVFITDMNQTDYYPGQSLIHVKLIYDPDTKVLLGGQIIGERGAVLRVDVLAAAIDRGMTTEQLGLLDLCYAPPFARTWDVLNVAANVAK